MELNITRLAPNDRRLQVDWMESGIPSGVSLAIQYTTSGKDWDDCVSLSVEHNQRKAMISNLENGLDYRLRLAALDDQEQVLVESATRLFRVGPVPGVVVNYIHPEDYTYNFSGRSTASPSIVKLPTGKLIASHDVFWGNHGQNLTLVFESSDQGNTWGFLSEISPCFWGKLFLHRSALYMLSTSTEYGALLIRRSDDQGKTWSEPTEILPAGDRESGGPHKAPVPVIEHHGRLFSAVELGSWSLGGHDAGVVSAPVDADLLDPKSWTVTPFLPYDPTWPGAIRNGENPSMLEGNVVVTPDGELVNILRYHTRGGQPDYGKAIMLDIDKERPWLPLKFRQVIDFEGNMSKFTILYDEQSKKYWSLVNRVTTENVNQRNVLTLVSSTNLVNWNIEADVLNYEDNGWPEDLTKVGFQYVDWLIDHDDILLLSRTAINGAWNFHNANHITFHRIENFRRLATF
ncbi:MAG: sialidase family protein [Limnochordia bacterium]|nr:sialidase family protein [Limnochordia bacterium]